MSNRCTPVVKILVPQQYVEEETTVCTGRIWVKLVPCKVYLQGEAPVMTFQRERTSVVDFAHRFGGENDNYTYMHPD